MSKFKQYLPWTIRIFIAILFLVSAFAKLYPSAITALGTFEAKQLLPMGFSEGFAPYFSRFIIAAEFSIGIAILQPHYLKRFVIPVASLLLFIFCVQLSYDIITKGASAGNCGCFGELIPMTPLQALIKNIIAIGLLVYLYILQAKDAGGQKFTYLLLIFTSISMFMFAGAPVQFATEQTVETDETVIHPDFMDEETPIVETGDTIVESDAQTEEVEHVTEVEIKDEPTGPKHVTSKFSKFTNFIPSGLKIDEGKKILCLFAPGCDHCRETAKILTEMKAEIPNFPPVHVVFMDEEPEKIPDFFDFAGRKYSHKVASVVDFWEILDFSRDTPGVVYLWNGNIRYFSDGINEKAFDRAAFKKELLKKK